MELLQLVWRVFLFQLLSLNQSFSGTATGIIGTSEIIKDIFINEPGVMYLIRRQVSLTAEPFYRFRVYFKSTAGLQNTKIII